MALSQLILRYLDRHFCFTRLCQTQHRLPGAHYLSHVCQYHFDHAVMLGTQRGVICLIARQSCLRLCCLECGFFGIQRGLADETFIVQFTITLCITLGQLVLRLRRTRLQSVICRIQTRQHVACLNLCACCNPPFDYLAACAKTQVNLMSGANLAAILMTACRSRFAHKPGQCWPFSSDGRRNFFVASGEQSCECDK